MRCIIDGAADQAKDLDQRPHDRAGRARRRVEYFHIELDTHDVIIAEGALSETFIDDDSRGIFHNAHQYETLYANETQLPRPYCAPRSPRTTRSKRCASAWRCAPACCATPTRPQLGALRGYIDRIRATSIAGWAQNSDAPEAPVCLEFFVDGELIGRALANSYREDLKRAGLGSGRHAFTFTPPAGLAFAPARSRCAARLDGAALDIQAQPAAPRPTSLHRRAAS